MTSYDKSQGIYLGNRGQEFKDLIIKLLKRGRLRSKYIKILTDTASMKIYSAAFTSDTVDEENNYQVYEQLGDLSGNKFIVTYMYRRFPQLMCSDGVKVAARLRINYGSKECFADIGKSLGFWPFISATTDARQRKMKPILEDVFEAFLGATEYILDDRMMTGVGYSIVYDILKGIFDDMDISLRYEDLYDAKTRLKELFDMYESTLGPLVYKEDKKESITYSEVYRVAGGTYQTRPNGTVNRKKILGGKYELIGRGSASLKADAQQAASACAIQLLAKMGYVKQPPRIYRKFRTGAKEDAVTKESLVEKWGEDINALVSTKNKMKYNCKYVSTPLALYCRIKCMSGVDAALALKADPNIADSDTLTPLDLLFMGKYDEEFAENVMKKLVKAGSELKMSDIVFDGYYTQYKREYFKSMIPRIKKFKFVVDSPKLLMV